MITKDNGILNGIKFAIDTTYSAIAPDVESGWLDYGDGEPIEWAEVVCDGNKVETYGEMSDAELAAWQAMTWQEKLALANSLHLW